MVFMPEKIIALLSVQCFMAGLYFFIIIFFFLQITFLPAQIFPVPFSTLIGYSKKITTAKSYSNWSSHSDTSRYVMTNLLQSFMDT